MEKIGLRELDQWKRENDLLRNAAYIDRSPIPGVTIKRFSIWKFFPKILSTQFKQTRKLKQTSIVPLIIFAIPES